MPETHVSSIFLTSLVDKPSLALAHYLKPLLTSKAERENEPMEPNTQEPTGRGLQWAIEAKNTGDQDFARRWEAGLKNEFPIDQHKTAEYFGKERLMAATEVAHYGTAEFRKDRFTPITSDEFNKQSLSKEDIINQARTIKGYIEKALTDGASSATGISFTPEELASMTNRLDLANKLVG